MKKFLNVEFVSKTKQSRFTLDYPVEKQEHTVELKNAYKGLTYDVAVNSSGERAGHVSVDKPYPYDCFNLSLNIDSDDKLMFKGEGDYPITAELWWVGCFWENNDKTVEHIEQECKNIIDQIVA